MGHYSMMILEFKALRAMNFIKPRVEPLSKLVRLPQIPDPCIYCPEMTMHWNEHVPYIIPTYHVLLRTAKLDANVYECTPATHWYASLLHGIYGQV